MMNNHQTLAKKHFMLVTEDLYELFGFKTASYLKKSK